MDVSEPRASPWAGLCGPFRAKLPESATPRGGLRGGFELKALSLLTLRRWTKTRKDYGSEAALAFRLALILASWLVSFSRLCRTLARSGSRARPLRELDRAAEGLFDKPIVMNVVSVFLDLVMRFAQNGVRIRVLRILPDDLPRKRHEMCDGCSGVVEASGLPLIRGYENRLFSKRIDRRRYDGIREAELGTPLPKRGNQGDRTSFGVSVNCRGGRRGAERIERTGRNSKQLGNDVVTIIANFFAFAGVHFFRINESNQPAERRQAPGEIRPLKPLSPIQAGSGGSAGRGVAIVPPVAFDHAARADRLELRAYSR